MLVRGDDLGKSTSAYLINRITASPCGAHPVTGVVGGLRGVRANRRSVVSFSDLTQVWTRRCCDSSPNLHATKHATDAGNPLIRSIQPVEEWGCCVDEVAMLIDSLNGDPGPPIAALLRPLFIALDAVLIAKASFVFAVFGVALVLSLPAAIRSRLAIGVADPVI